MWPSGIYGEPRCPRAEKDPNDPCQLNALWTETDEYSQAHPGVYSEMVPGRTETRDAIGEILGLEIDQIVVIDLKGFAKLIDAMGGLDINVKLSGYGTKLTIGGAHDASGRLYGVKGYFDPGLQHLNGWKSLWYARTRAADSDTFRQMRQRCVIQAIVQQVNPAQMVSKYPEVASILKDNIYTDIPGQNLPAFVELIQRVQKAKITTLGLTQSQGVESWDPDYELVHQLVTKALEPPKATPKPTKTKTPTKTSTSSTSSTDSYETC